MISLIVAGSGWMDRAEMLLNVGSAFAGILGTFFMSRRYAGTFLFGVLFALTAPIRIVFGQKKKVLEFIETMARGSAGGASPVYDMTLGLSLLFWAFFLQLLSILVAAITKA